MVSALLTLHSLNTNSPYLDSLLNFQLDSNLKFFMDFFKSAFLRIFHLSYIGPFGMVFEHLWNFFNLKNSINGFIQLHQLCSYVAIDYIPRSIA
jgi:hypothetical protein